MRARLHQNRVSHTPSPRPGPSPISRPPPPQGAPHSGERRCQMGHVDPLRGPRRAGEPASSSQSHEPHPAAASVRKRRVHKFSTTRLTTLTAPASSTPRKPTAAPTRTPGASHGLVGPRGACGAHPARASPDSRGMCRAAWNTVRHCESMFVSRTAPTGLDAWSSWRGQAGRVLVLHPRARRRRVEARHGIVWAPARAGGAGAGLRGHVGHPHGPHGDLRVVPAVQAGRRGPGRAPARARTARGQSVGPTVAFVDHDAEGWGRVRHVVAI